MITTTYLTFTAPRCELCSSILDGNRLPFTMQTIAHGRTYKRMDSILSNSKTSKCASCYVVARLYSKVRMLRTLYLLGSNVLGGRRFSPTKGDELWYPELGMLFDIARKREDSSGYYRLMISRFK